MDFSNLFIVRREDEIPHEDQVDIEGAVDLTALAAENNDFAVALYRELLPTASNENFVFSPFCIRIALAMARAGAAGTTADEMDEVLRFCSPGETRPHELFQAALDRYSGTNPKLAQVAVANSIWIQTGMTLREQFYEVVRQHYGAEVRMADFAREPAQAAQAINNWVEQQTRGRIRDLAPPDAGDRETGMVLANAIYFKSDWNSMFEPSQTRNGDYFPGSNTAVHVAFMKRTGSMRYARRASYQAIELGFRSRKFSFLVLLPDQIDGLLELETQLTAMEILDCVQNLKTCTVTLLLPKFTFRHKCTNLHHDLAALGMPSAFNPEAADFSGMNGCRPPDENAFFLGPVLHSAFIAVNEAGVEAAAATAGFSCMLGSGFPDPQPIRVDHPFLFAIRDTSNGTILFLGRVWDPRRLS